MDMQRIILVDIWKEDTQFLHVLSYESLGALFRETLGPPAKNAISKWEFRITQPLRFLYSHTRYDSGGRSMTK